MTTIEDKVFAVLKQIPAPGGRTSLAESGAVRHVAVEGTTVQLMIAIQSAQEKDAASLRGQIEQTICSLDGVEKCDVDLHVLSPQPTTEATEQAYPWAERIASVKRVVAIASGKGGVGKSTIAANFSLALADHGYRVGLLDADIYGPSQQLMLGASGEPEGDEEGKILPYEVHGGVKMMSFGCIMDTDQPVIWRGPMLMKALEQFFSDVRWGELDYLVVDLPPGTGDVALTLCQNVEVAGVVIVTTPQDVALIDARKSLNMFRKLEVPVLGIVENMAFYECPSCGHKEQVFGEGGGQRTATELNLPLLAKVPLDPIVVAGGDQGRPVVVDRPDSAPAKALSQLATTVAESLKDWVNESSSPGVNLSVK
ncbi:MAG: Mrp/NBP35 family ATP-binding protein [bacterium]|nr:Mrp/NBP35 family ATP-binding protein [bacterium]